MTSASLLTRKLFVRRDRPDAISPKRQLLNLLPVYSFHWLWTPDIINDYERGAETIEADERIMRRAEFDRIGFQLFVAALQLEPPVAISVTTMRNARRRISQAPRAAERDLDDAIYLACAVDGEAHLLTTEDSDLRLLGETYQDVRIVNWKELKATLIERGLTVS